MGLQRRYYAPSKARLHSTDGEGRVLASKLETVAKDAKY